MISPSLHQAPRPSTHPPEVWHPLRWGAAARPPEAQPGGFAARRAAGLGRSSPAWGGAQWVQTNPAKGPLPPRGRPSDQAQFAAGTAGPGRLPRARTEHLPPTRPEPPDPSVALSRVAGTQPQAPSGREEAVVAGRGGAGRGYLRRAPPGRGTWERLSRRTKAAGDGSPPPLPPGACP